ncbi:hypothetical protein [Endozoicomonas arenosclerae]|uniref:hypothetical protein n=1 Tax=Endozoicomonas arenosclerae TaxID=1633495 RepID=UPI001294826D|nr:hypothetical protein [Endozoicomonas arenosclerae]
MKTGPVMEKPVKHYLNQPSPPVKVYIGKALILILDLASSNSLLCSKSTPFHFRPDAIHEIETFKVTRKPYNPHFKPNNTQTKPSKSNWPDSFDNPPSQRVKPSPWKRSLDSYRYQLPDELIQRLNPRSNIAILFSDFIAAIPSSFFNPHEHHNPQGEGFPDATPVSTHTFVSHNEGEATHFYASKASVQDQIQISHLTTSMLEDPWLQEQVNQAYLQSLSPPMPTKAERDAELMELQFMAANATGDYRRILQDLIRVLIADDLGEFGRIATPEELEQIRQQHRRAERVDYLTRRYLRIHEQEEGYRIEVINPLQTLTPGQQILVEEFPDWQALLSTALEMIEARELADQINTSLSTEPQPSPEPSDADKDDSKEQTRFRNPKEEKKSDPPKPPEKQDKDEENARRQDHPQDTPPPVTGATNVITDGTHQPFRHRPETYEMARLLMGITPNYNLYRTLRGYLVDVVGPENLSTFMESCYHEIHESILHSPFSLRVPIQTMLMFTTLKRFQEEYQELHKQQTQSPKSDELDHKVELAKQKLLKQLIDYTVFEDRPALLVSQLARHLPPVTFDELLAHLQANHRLQNSHHSPMDGIRYPSDERLRNEGVTVYITNVDADNTPIRCLVRQHDQVLLCSSDLPSPPQPLEPAAANPEPVIETIGSSLQNTLQGSDDLKVLTHPERSVAASDEATQAQKEKRKKVQGQIVRDLVRSNLFLSVTIGNETIVIYDNKKAIASIRSHLIDMTPAASKPVTRQRSQSFRSKSKPKGQQHNADTSMDLVVQYRLIQSFFDYINLYLSSDPALALSIGFASTQALGNDAYTFIMSNLRRGMEHAVASPENVKLLLNREIGSIDAEFIYESPFPEFAPPPWTMGDVVSQKRPSIGGLWVSGQFVQGTDSIWRATGLSWVYDIKEDSIDLGQALEMTDGQPDSPVNPLMTWEQALATLTRLNSNDHSSSGRTSVDLEQESEPARLTRSQSDTALHEMNGRYQGSTAVATYPVLVLNQRPTSNLRRIPFRDLSLERDETPAYSIDPMTDTCPTISLFPQIPGATCPIFPSTSAGAYHERSQSDSLVLEKSSSTSRGDSIDREITERQP